VKTFWLIEDVCFFHVVYRGADKSLARPWSQCFCQNGVYFLRCLALQEKRNLTTAHVSVLLKSRTSLTCFRACFLPGQAKDLSSPQYLYFISFVWCPHMSLLQQWQGAMESLCLSLFILPYFT